jgi:hypothetical protein
MSGYGTTIQLFDPSTFTALIANPIPITALIVLMGASAAKSGPTAAAKGDAKSISEKTSQS